MKAPHSKAICAFVLVIISATAFAQLNSGPKNVGDTAEPRGYWVIESNVKTPRQNVIHYYTMGHILVHSETMNGRKIRAENRRTQMHLKEKTALAVGLYEKMAKIEEEVENKQ